MSSSPAFFSICIPAYNRAKHLPALLDSIFAQDFRDFEVVICEDKSPERSEIAEIVHRYQMLYPAVINYHENPDNLGYDANIRQLVEKAAGRYCFFMGNDDLVCEHAFARVADLLRRHENVGVVLKSYAWFDETPDRIAQTVIYFDHERVFSPGHDAIGVCFRRSGVISGYIVEREGAQRAATAKFDGSLYYQMHLSASVLSSKCAVSTPHVLVLCRNSEPPEFGNSKNEKGIYTPGSYTPTARVNMMSGALEIIRDLKESTGIDLVDEIKRDYANYFYLCIRDQLSLPVRSYLSMYRAFGRLGFDRYPSFHAYCISAYILGQRRCDRLIRFVRARLGRSPRWGTAR